MKKIALISLAILLSTAVPGFATPSTQLWNPSTDIQSQGTWHLGIDNYFTKESLTTGGYAFPTDIGLTYGALPGLELGIDICLPQESPFVFNAKYGISESKTMPIAAAVGIYGVGTQPNVTDQDVIYGVISKTFDLGRISVGYFTGNANVLMDPSTGKADNNGIILTYDKTLSDKLWVCVDYAGTKSALGSTFYGLAWTFSSNTSVILGYGTYNNGSKPTITTQVDINI